MSYSLTLDEEALAAIEELKSLLEVDTTGDVLSLCLGFVYQLMLLAAENEQVKEFVEALSERFNQEYDDNSMSN